jgi:hypothetical protein
LYETDSERGDRVLGQASTTGTSRGTEPSVTDVVSH